MTVLIWAKRGLGFFVFTLLIGFVLWTSITARPWQLEFDWAARYGAAYVYLIAPLLAAAVSFDVGRRARPEMTLMGATARRGLMAFMAPALAALGWAVLAAVGGWGVMAAITTFSGGLAPRDPWIFVETLSSLAAAAAVGMLLGLLVEGILAVAVSAGAVLVAATVTSGHGANLFQVATSSGTLVGIERTPQRAIATVVCHLTLVAVAAACVAARQRAHPLSTPWLLTAAVAALVPVVTAMVWPYSASEYRPSGELQACVGSQVRVCGPSSAKPLLLMAATDLQQATTKLRPSGLPLPESFAIARGSAAERLPRDQTLLDLDSSQLVEGHLPSSTIASALATPRLCRGFYSSQEAPALIERVRVVSEWLTSALADQSSPGPAPEVVVSSFAVLSQCPQK